MNSFGNLFNNVQRRIKISMYGDKLKHID